MLEIGPYLVSAVDTGRFALDGGAMFGIVPKTIWEKTNPADSSNRIDMRLRAMLIQSRASAKQPARNILVDCGIGAKWSPKHQSIYAIDHSSQSLEKGLALKGLKPSDITDLILTHLHFDHAGGLTYLDGKDILPTFPNAKVYLQRRNWELAWHPSEKDRASYLTENYSPYADPAQSGRKLELIETRAIEPTGKEKYDSPRSEETEIFPGIHVEVSNGHTLGMQLVRVTNPDPGQRKSGPSILYCADLIPTSSHVRMPFIMAYDCYPMFLLEEKRLVLRRAAEQGSYLFYEHCPRMAASTVRVKGEDFELGSALLDEHPKPSESP